MAKETQMVEGEVVSGSANTPNNFTQVEKMRRIMELESDIAGSSNAREIVSRIQQNILESNTDDDVFANADISLPSAEDFVDIPTLILGFALSRSSFKEDGGLPAFAIVSAINLNDGQEVNYSIGAESAVTQLFRWEQIQKFSERTVTNEKGDSVQGFGAAIKGKGTASGYTALMYRPLSPAERSRGGIK